MFYTVHSLLKVVRFHVKSRLIILIADEEINDSFNNQVMISYNLSVNKRQVSNIFILSMYNQFVNCTPFYILKTNFPRREFVDCCLC